MSASDNLLKSMQTIAQQEITKAPFDKMRKAQIIYVNADNTFGIKMDGVDYPRVKAYGNTSNVSIGQIVEVVIPGNQPSQMFILTPTKVAEEDIETLESDISSLDTRVTTTESDISTLESSVLRKGDLVAQTFSKNNVSISANNYVSGQTISVAKSGYTPICIVNYYCSNADSGGQGVSWCNIYLCTLSGTTVTAGVRNYASSTSKIDIHVTVLFKKL